MKRWLARLGAQEDLNFLLTNRIPRLLVTRLMGRLAAIEHPWLVRALLWVWQLFTKLDLCEAEPGPYRSLQQVFTRKLRAGMRPIDPRPEVFTSPCDAIVGEFGGIGRGQLLQAKGMAYPMDDLLRDEALCHALLGGTFVTLRLTSAMYHRFHAPSDCTIEEVLYHAGDTWNVNPIALARVERLFCRNERAVLRCRLPDRSGHFALVPVAAILVASLRFHWLPDLFNQHWRGRQRVPCAHEATKGEELGWFEHGSTIIVLVPPGFRPVDELAVGRQIRMGQPLLTTS